MLPLVILIVVLLVLRGVASPSASAGGGAVNLSEHFKASEFDLEGAPSAVIDAYRSLATKTLEPLRSATGDSPLYVTAHGGLHRDGQGVKRPPGSRHRDPSTRPPKHAKGVAADVYSKTFSPKELGTLAVELMAEGKIPKGGVAVYGSFLHLDDRGAFVSWKTGASPALKWPGQTLAQNAADAGDDDNEDDGVA